MSNKSKPLLTRDYLFKHVTPEMYSEYANVGILISNSQLKGMITVSTRTSSMFRILLDNTPKQDIRDFSRYLYFLEVYVGLVYYLLDLRGLCYPVSFSPNIIAGHTGVIYGFPKVGLNYWLNYHKK